ncbi:cytochrome P450 [Laetiporus sulphureus 93-53]|uniref:Cytochrome P450 n=1 Tax=Laetiporus sulphureus 93-53 TaxID=1314785 RepID=A0A165GQ15_9APHY|nr:cytochrome P450 [Laetiporus sulphureus 93-53]KZT10650.1 cytochrome P450 [Laetiporus sulphureus 93-53]
MLYAYILTVLILAVLFGLCLKYPATALGTKPRLDLLGPQGLPVLGNLLDIYPHRLHILSWITAMGRQYGELFSWTVPLTGRTIVINRPEWIDHVHKNEGTIYGKGEVALAVFSQFPGRGSPFSTEGAEWRHSRKVIKPVFEARNLAIGVSEIMEEMMTLAHGLLHYAAKRDVTIDFNELCGRLVLAIFCKLALSLDMPLLTDASCLSEPHVIVENLHVLNTISSGRLPNPFWTITEKLDGRERRFKAARQQLFKVIEDIIKSRQDASDNGGTHRDFLSTLLEEEDTTDLDLMRDELVSLLFAGRDTTQNALIWSLHELSRSPAWFDKMREEAQMNALPPNHAADPCTRLQNYPIHLAVLYETLRLWPGVPKNGRSALRDDVLPAIPDRGYDPIRVGKGNFVAWSDWDMMKGEAIWGPDAKVFNPARHLDAERRFVKPPSPKFHAFGAGPRLCPGVQLASYEFVAIWANLLPSFDFVAEVKERYPTDALTITMREPFIVKAIPWSG